MPLLAKTFQDLGPGPSSSSGYTAMLGDPDRAATKLVPANPRTGDGQCRTYEEQALRSSTAAGPSGVQRLLVQQDAFYRCVALLSRMTWRMLEREDFANRYRSEVPIGLHELVYPLMQVMTQL